MLGFTLILQPEPDVTHIGYSRVHKLIHKSVGRWDWDGQSWEGGLQKSSKYFFIFQGFVYNLATPRPTRHTRPTYYTT